MRIRPAQVAWYVTGRFYEDQNNLLQDVGYFLYLAGVSGSLFDRAMGDMGEGTARLTFRSEPFSSKPVTNGDVSIGLDAVGTFGVYLNPGGATFDSPESFSQGQRIAVFRRVSVVMGETLSSPLLGGLAIGMNVFSAELVESAPFQLPDGHGPADLGELLPNGVTQWGVASENPLSALPQYQRIVAFTGSAIAVGGFQ